MENKKSMVQSRVMEIKEKFSEMSIKLDENKSIFFYCFNKKNKTILIDVNNRLVYDACNIDPDIIRYTGGLEKSLAGLKASGKITTDIIQSEKGGITFSFIGLDNRFKKSLHSYTVEFTLYLEISKPKDIEETNLSSQESDLKVKESLFNNRFLDNNNNIPILEESHIKPTFLSELNDSLDKILENDTLNQQPNYTDSILLVLRNIASSYKKKGDIERAVNRLKAEFDTCDNGYVVDHALDIFNNENAQVAGDINSEDICVTKKVTIPELEYLSKMVKAKEIIINEQCAVHPPYKSNALASIKARLIKDSIEQSFEQLLYTKIGEIFFGHKEKSNDALDIMSSIIDPNSLYRQTKDKINASEESTSKAILDSKTITFNRMFIDSWDKYTLDIDVSLIRKNNNRYLRLFIKDNGVHRILRNELMNNIISFNEDQIEYGMRLKEQDLFGPVNNTRGQILIKKDIISFVIPNMDNKQGINIDVRRTRGIDLSMKEDGIVDILLYQVRTRDMLALQTLDRFFRNFTK